MDEHDKRLASPERTLLTAREYRWGYRILFWSAVLGTAVGRMAFALAALAFASELALR